MKDVDVGQIIKTVARLCVQANRALPSDVSEVLQRMRAEEPWPPAQKTLDKMAQNTAEATAQGLPICQDTGVANVFVRLGQEVHICGGLLQDAVNEGVRQGYGEGYLRKSLVDDPLRRQNTGDNTPAFLTVELVLGGSVEITVMPKGFGSENMSRLAMLNPADGRKGVMDFVVNTVRQAGPNPCPPIVVGVGIGGTFDKVAALAKKALLRPLNASNTDHDYETMEAELLEKINALGTGPAGYGGRTTALAVAIETAPTHIAGLPVAVNINCHVARRASAKL